MVRKHLFGVGLILEENSKIVLQHRNNDPRILFPNYWCIFTGRIEESDWQGNISSTLEHAVIREIGEELAVQRNGLAACHFVPAEIRFFGKYDLSFSVGGTDYTQEAFIYMSRLHVPFCDLRLKEGIGICLLGRDDVKGLQIPVSYVEAISDYFNHQARHSINQSRRQLRA